MSPSSPTTVLATLKDFQKRTVEHVFDRLYVAGDSTRRFLVADEVGMGKTLVAKGVVSKAVEYLNGVDSVQRIDIIYICSNSAIARQNIQKLNIFGTDTKHPNTRITMLAAQAHNLNEETPGKKKINLIAFTPGTSFEKGQRGGMRSERALIFVMLKDLFEDKVRQKNLSKVLRLNVGKQGWDFSISELSAKGKIDADVKRRFLLEVTKEPLWQELNQFVDECPSSKDLSKDLRTRAGNLVGTIRGALARASIEALEPDLIILDEFQRFKHLLEKPEEDADVGDVRLLAQKLFGYEGVRTLLLSATPYKLFTMAGEEGISGDDHYKDFLATTKFLVGDEVAKVAEIEEAFKNYRESLITGQNIEKSRLKAQDILVRVMSRTERPTIGESGMGLELDDPLLPPTAEELSGYVAMDRMAQDLGTSVQIDFWKSAPYFLNFMDGYKVGQTFIESIEAYGASSIPKHAQVVTTAQVKNRQKIEPGNARLRNLQKQVIDTGLWKLLWLPPSLPYLQLGGPYEPLDRANITKRLIFSSWSAAPNSISSLLSHEVSSRIFADLEAGRNPYEQTKRLTYRKSDGQAKGMTTLALFTPIAELAAQTDVLSLVRLHGGSPLPSEQVVRETKENLKRELTTLVGQPSGPRSESWFWTAPFLFMQDRSSLSLLDSLEEVDEAEGESEIDARQLSLETAMDLSTSNAGSTPADLDEWVAMLGLFGPANIAYRALKRTAAPLAPSEDTLMLASAIIGEGFRSLFNRPESMFLIDQLYEQSTEDYWQRVLRYCMDGDLQSVIDEYLHHLVVNDSPKNDDELIELARNVSDAMSLKTSPVHLFNPRNPDKNILVNTRFAVRYGSAKGGAKSDENSENRMTSVQKAFNSPFWPMVLASTSVGQEGVDFHWWCHSLVHWNLPANPVDIEQREGRIHRFAGHAVRKNIAAKYWPALANSDGENPWTALFEAALADRDEAKTSEMGDLWPWWVFPGESKIVTWTPVLPFSKDEARLQKMKRMRAIYRLAFGQPRQEDLISILKEDAGKFSPLDLRPPQAL